MTLAVMIIMLVSSYFRNKDLDAHNKEVKAELKGIHDLVNSEHSKLQKQYDKALAHVVGLTNKVEDLQEKVESLGGPAAPLKDGDSDA